MPGLKRRPVFKHAARPSSEEYMFGLTRLRIVEIGVALLLTLAALIFVGLTVWAAEPEFANDGAEDRSASASSGGIAR
jgi:hypothetical protein